MKRKKRIWRFSFVVYSPIGVRLFKIYYGEDETLILNRLRDEKRLLATLDWDQFKSEVSMPSIIPDKVLRVVIHPEEKDVSALMKRRMFRDGVAVFKSKPDVAGCEMVEVKAYEDKDRREWIKNKVAASLNFSGTRSDKIKTFNLLAKHLPKKFTEMVTATENFILVCKTPFTLSATQEYFGGFEKFWSIAYDFLSTLKREHFVSLVRISNEIGSNVAKSLFIREIFDVLYFRVMKEARFEFKIRQYKRVNLSNTKLYQLLSVLDHGVLDDFVEFVNG